MNNHASRFQGPNGLWFWGMIVNNSDNLLTLLKMMLVKIVSMKLKDKKPCF